MSKLSNTIRSIQHEFCTAIVPAAGASQRMGEDKLLLALDGVPVLARTLAALELCPAVDEIVVVTTEARFGAVGEMRERYGITKLTKLIPGGANRTESVLAGAVAASSKAKLLCIHDGARPFVTGELAETVIRAAQLYRAAAPALPLKETVKRAENGIVTETVPREDLFSVQTPQVFQADILKAALTKAVDEKISFTDDCGAVEALGVQVHLTAGDEDNIKLTTPGDLTLARAILEKRSAGR